MPTKGRGVPSGRAERRSLGPTGMGLPGDGYLVIKLLGHDCRGGERAPATKEEIARLKKNLIEPDKRYYYRFIAAAVAMRAAALLPDQTEELADAVNTAGNWIKNSDEEIGNSYFQVIDRRCSKTKLGAQASAAHWYVDAQEPWSRTVEQAQLRIIRSRWRRSTTLCGTPLVDQYLSICGKSERRK